MTEGVCFITNGSFQYHIWVGRRMFYYTVLFYYRLQFQVQNKHLNWGTYLILEISVWLDLNMVSTWLESREALNNMRKKATDVLLRSTVLRGFTARWDSTFIEDIPGFISVERIVFHLYVVWQRHAITFVRGMNVPTEWARSHMK